MPAVARASIINEMDNITLKKQKELAIWKIVPKRASASIFVRERGRGGPVGAPLEPGLKITIIIIKHLIP